MHLNKKFINYCITHHDWQVINCVSREKCLVYFNKFAYTSGVCTKKKKKKKNIVMKHTYYWP